MNRIVSALIVLLVGCSAHVSSAPASTSFPSDLEDKAKEVIESLDALAASFDAVEQSDIAMAWSDLQRDLRSLVDEAVSQPDGVRLDGVEDRIEGFRSRFQSNKEVTATRTQWERLIERLEELSNRLDF